MVVLIILGVIVVLIAAIMLIPVGADIGYEGGALRASAKVCGVMLQLFPKPPKDTSKPPKEPKPKKEKPQKADKTDKPKKKPELNFSTEEWFDLVKAALKGLGRFGKLKVERFLLHYTAAGFDPYNTAMGYNYVNAALSSLAPICRQKFIVKNSDVWTDIDFTKDFMEIDIGLCITLRIGQVFRVAFAVAFGALNIYIKSRFRLRREKALARKEERQAAKETDSSASNIENQDEQNIQQAERTDTDEQ